MVFEVHILRYHLHRSTIFKAFGLLGEVKIDSIMVNKAEHSHASLMAMRLLHMFYGVALHEAERRVALTF